ncbi:MAG: muramoyltetrapeptide carboxypeptidase [Patescibacteria group bacterium]|nr:muramoyltetrapeptide carboxypeptidase [Patescibacteria group bacterium]
MPSLADSVLFLEEDEETNPPLFDRLVQSLIHQKDFSGVRALVIGRFQRKSGMTREKLEKIIRSKPELANLPVIANADFGHTNPLITFPIGGTVRIDFGSDAREMRFITH